MMIVRCSEAYIKVLRHVNEENKCIYYTKGMVLSSKAFICGETYCTFNFFAISRSICYGRNG